MTILFARNIEKSFGDRTIFTLPSLEIHAHDRIGIVGVNGAGKSTLLQILSKEIEADKGTVTHHSSIAIIPQLSDTILETASSLAKENGVFQTSQIQWRRTNAPKDCPCSRTRCRHFIR